MSEINLTSDNLLSLTCHLNADDCEAYDSRYEISAALESLALVLFKADWDYPVTIVAIAGLAIMVEYIAALHQDHDLEIDHRFMRFSQVWIEYRRQRSFTANQQNHAIDIEKSGETVPLEEYPIEEKEEGGAGT